MSVTASFKKQLAATLTTIPYFEAEDWSVSSETRGSATTLTIQYVYAEQYVFVARIPQAKSKFNSRDGNAYPTFDFDISVKYAPGEASVEETGHVAGTSDLLKEIRAWCSRVHDDLLAQPLARSVTAQREAIDSLFETLGEVENLADEAFTSEEGDRLKENLQSLEDKMAAGFAAQESDAKARDAIIERLHGELETLRADVDRLGKRGWLRKFAKWAQRNQTAIVAKILTGGAREIIKGLLPP